MIAWKQKNFGKTFGILIPTYGKNALECWQGILFAQKV